MARRPERVLLAGCIAIVAAAGYNAAVRHASVPNIMRYVPAESAVYVVTSPLDVLWNRLDPHLRPLFGATEHVQANTGSRVQSSYGESLARDIVKALEEKKIDLAKAEDLAGLGIDARSGVALALIGGGGQYQPLIILPLVDRPRFEATLVKLTGEPLELMQEEHDTRSQWQQVYKSGGVRLVYAEDDIALLAEDVQLLNRARETQQQNIAYFRSNDRSISGFGALLPSRQGSTDAWIRGAVQLARFSLPVVNDAQFVVAVDERTIAFRGRVAMNDGGSAALGRLLAPSSVDAAAARGVLAQSSGAAVLMDPALPDYLRLLSSIISAESLADLRSIIPAFLVDEIAAAASLRGMSLTLSDESKRLPGFVLGLQLAPDDASDLVFRLQKRLRLERDRQVLKAAAERYRAQVADSTKTSTPATGSDLVLAGLLSEQRDPLWSRYRFDDGVVSPTAPIELRDFDRPSYVTAHGEHKLQYLLPPFTVDDVNYRLTEDERSSVSASDLEQDKYRTTSGYVGGTLWIGNDAEVLANWLDRLSSAGARVAYDSVVARMEGIGRAKFALFVQPREFLEAGQLHPDPRVNRETRRFLMDFRHYRAMMVTIGANDHEREIDVAGTLLGH